MTTKISHAPDRRRSLTLPLFHPLTLAFLLGLPFIAGAGDKKTDTYAESLAEFIAQSRQQTPAVSPSEGSLFTDGVTLWEDFKARRVNDTITIVVSESTTAINSADASSERAATKDLGISSLFGIETHIPESTGIDMSNLVSAESASTFDGKGTTSRKGSISTTITARVREVFPNGNLLIEGVRELGVNHEKQTIMITGIVRPRDISTNNIVSSKAIADLQVRYFGKGIVNDNLKPGILYRVFTWIWPF